MSQEHEGQSSPQAAEHGLGDTEAGRAVLEVLGPVQGEIYP